MRTAPALILLTWFALSVAAAPAPLRYTVMNFGEIAHARPTFRDNGRIRDH